MSVGAQAERSGSSAAGAARGGDEPALRPDTAGRLLGRLSVLPALLVMAWLLVGLPLLLAGVFTPVLMVVLSVPVAAVLLVLGLRWNPGWWPGAEPETAPEESEQDRPRTPWWAVAGVLAVALAFGVDQLIYHSQFIIVTRDPASYIQFANWISHHGSLPITQDRAAFGGTHGVLTFASFAYYQVGSTVVPQFMAGLPMLLAGAFWTGGVGMAVGMGALFGACGVLAFSGLVARLAGPRWAPLGALILALSLPEQFVSRSTYSEPVAQILFLGGLCLVIDSLRAEGRRARIAAALGGLAIGLTLLVRIDGASDILPLIPYCGILLIGRRRQAVPLIGGLLVGGIYGIVDGLVLTRPYLAAIKGSLLPLAALAGLVTIGTLIAMAVLWQRGLPAVRGKWLPNALAALAVVVVAGFYFRPYVQTARAKSSTFFESIIASYQRADHLPVAPDRIYYEISLHWVIWYVGLPAVVLATVGAAILARRCVRGLAPTWTLPLMVFAWTIVATLYDPAITPDNPWASRRLVPAVLPGFILLAVWATAWLNRWLRRADIVRALRVALMTCCAAALLLPAIVTTFGLKAASGGPAGIRITAHGLAFKRTYDGEIAAVDHLCAAIGRNASVVFIGGSNGGGASRLTQTVRGMCGVPAADIVSPHPRSVAQVVLGIDQAGRRPVFLADIRSRLEPYGGRVRMVMALRSTQDMNALTAPPTHTLPFDVVLWMSEPTR
jgi:hypothetical protein